MTEEVVQKPTPTRRQVLAGGLAVLVAGAAAYPITAGRHHLVVERHTIRIRHLPSAFEGFTIAQVSDFHYHRYSEPWFLEHVVEQVNGLQPDLVALTGDFITAEFDPRLNGVHANSCAEIMARLRCPLRICSLGNHDFVDLAGTTQALESNGLTVLRNAHLALDRRGDRLWVAGLADAYFDVPDLSLTLPSERREGEPVILLGHEPDFADEVVFQAKQTVDLMLAGHTHGGQVRLPGLPPFFLPGLGEIYVEGLFHVGEMQLYVSRGVGTVHMPVRFRCPPEITLLQLQPAT